MTLTLNSADEYDSISLIVSPHIHSTAWQAWKNDLVENNKWTEEEADTYMREIMANDGIEMEVYYEPGCGFMLVEAEAVESSTIYSPYTGEMYDELGP